MQLRMGQVVISEGDRSKLVSRLIARNTGSWATHAFLSLGADYAMEATFPKVRLISTGERLKHLEESDRAYAVLDVPGLKLWQRYHLTIQALKYEGRYYDVGQMLLYAATSRFWSDGTGTMVCSRLITASYLEGAKFDLFSDAMLAEKYPQTHPRLPNLKDGYATPLDLLNSNLEVVAFRPSSMITSVSDFLPRSAGR